MPWRHLIFIVPSTSDNCPWSWMPTSEILRIRLLIEKVKSKHSSDYLTWNLTIYSKDLFAWQSQKLTKYGSTHKQVSSTVLNTSLHEWEFSLLRCCSNENLMKMCELMSCEAIAICHWNLHTCRLGGKCAGKLAWTVLNQLDLVMPKPCVLLVNKEVGWLVGWLAGSGRKLGSSASTLSMVPGTE